MKRTNHSSRGSHFSTVNGQKSRFKIQQSIVKRANHSSRGSHTPAANQLSPPRLLGSGSRRIAGSSKSCNQSKSENHLKPIPGFSAPASVLLKLEKSNSWVPERIKNDQPPVQSMQKGTKTLDQLGWRSPRVSLLEPSGPTMG